MLLNKTECKCGLDLKQIRFDTYEQNHDVFFYGGRVHMIGIYKCECGRLVKGYFSRNIHGELDLIDLEILEDIEEEEIIENEPILGQEDIVEDAKEEENAPYTVRDADVPVIEENGDNILETNQDLNATDIDVGHKETKPKTTKKKK